MVGRKLVSNRAVAFKEVDVGVIRSMALLAFDNQKITRIADAPQFI
jgi:hypothetical protein